MEPRWNSGRRDSDGVFSSGIGLAVRLRATGHTHTHTHQRTGKYALLFHTHFLRTEEKGELTDGVEGKVKYREG